VIGDVQIHGELLAGASASICTPLADWIRADIVLSASLPTLCLPGALCRACLHAGNRRDVARPERDARG